MKKIIVITGGAGFVGSNLIELFLKKTRYKILSIDNYSSGFKRNHIRNRRVKYIKDDTKNISTCFLLLRNLGSLSWLSYGILEEDNWIISSYSITLTSTMIISYYKLKDKLKKNNIQNNP